VFNGAGPFTREKGGESNNPQNHELKKPWKVTWMDGTSSSQKIERKGSRIRNKGAPSTPIQNQGANGPAVPAVPPKGGELVSLQRHGKSLERARMEAGKTTTHPKKGGVIAGLKENQKKKEREETQKNTKKKKERKREREVPWVYNRGKDQAIGKPGCGGWSAAKT